ncbi:VanZ family protein [Sphaerisporangium perillae]|uniref:VanZ family protein n=1 Tax=Sphaerisporangium perillae TaxID=2935860 RepID=UPI0020109AC2|nr:VanZ family protein [Sphaerisporangium perillae]
MRLEWHLWGHVVLATLLLLPVAVALAHLLAAWRAGRGRAHAARTAYADVFIAAGTLPWLWMILTPGSASGVSLVPLRDLAELAGGPPGAAFAQVGGNLLVFAALGALLPVRSARMASLWRVALIAASLSVTVEVLQYGLRLGRVSSVDDVLLNTAGALLGALVTRPWRARTAPVGTGPQ